MVDAHLHLRDTRIIPYHARFVKEALDCGVTECIDCAVTPEQWACEVSCSLNVTTAYGLHPWYASVAPPDWLERLTCCLRTDSHALVGEIGLDGIRKVPDGGAMQRQILSEQLALAVRFGRPVVLHGARAWAPLLRFLQPWVTRLPAILLHGVSFSEELLNHPTLRAENIWYSVGSALLTPGAKTIPALAKALPLDRLLVETDAPDMFPHGGDPLVLGQFHTILNHPANLPLTLQQIAMLRAIPFPELAELTTHNAHTFLAH